MLVFKIFSLLILHNAMLAECSVLTLSVQKVDRKIIERKRQDTREMCRLFNAELEATQDKSRYAILSKTLTETKRRSKREVEVPVEQVRYGNPMLSEKDAQRVESIVDKLYDDVDEDGKKIPYRKKKIETSTVKVGLNKTAGSRRFDFAPAELLWPLSKLKEREEDNNITTFHMPWPKSWFHGIVPYFIDPKTYDNHLVDVIMDAFDYFEHATCIRLQRLRERPVDKKSLSGVEWVYITNPSGIHQCVHSNENKVNKGVQIVVFGYDCMSRGEILHEVMHVLGFSHEHTRPDRDKFISVMWDNIKPGYKKYFEARKSDSLLLPYDYSSVMHYPPRAFSKNGKATLVAEFKMGPKLGQRQGLSETDLEKVKIVFGQDCEDRNRVYLLKTCPTLNAIKKQNKTEVTPEQIQNYYKGRIWSYGIVNYKLRDRTEFSIEEKENIKAVIRHIEKETCIEFREVDAEDDDDVENNDFKGTAKDSTTNNSIEGQDSTLGEFTKLRGITSTKKDPKSEEAEGHFATLPANEKYPAKNEDDDDVDKVIENHKVSSDYEAYTFPRVELATDNIKRSANRTTTINPTSKSINENKISKDEDQKGGKVRRKRSIPPSPARRHANSILILTRSAKPGCECPKPGITERIQMIQIFQMIELSTDCFNSANDLLHVFGHILGLDHQHNMWDRDDYLYIQWEDLTDEIKKEMKQKLPREASAGFAYDYQSVMHYPWLQIKNGVTNIMYPIWNDGWAMGHWQGLSSTDVRKLNTLYFQQCVERKKHADDDKL